MKDYTSRDYRKVMYKHPIYIFRACNENPIGKLRVVEGNHFFSTHYENYI